MKPESQQLLLECARRTAEHRQTKCPKWWEPTNEEWHDTKAHGPRYNSHEWFGYDFPEAVRMRYQRSIRDLERDGLIVTWAKYGRKMSHFALTAAGVAEAKRLQSEAKP